MEDGENVFDKGVEVFVLRVIYVVLICLVCQVLISLKWMTYKGITHLWIERRSAKCFSCYGSGK